MTMLLTLLAPYTESYMLITVPADILAQNDKAILAIEEIYSIWPVDIYIKMGYGKLCWYQQLYSSHRFKLALGYQGC